MPELPEVETIRHDLEKEVVGKRIKSVEVSGLRSIRRHPSKKAFISRIEGQKVESVGRKGKNLLVGLGDDVLVIHLGMSGQLLKAAAKDPVAPHTHVTVTFTQGGQLRYVDPRTFGELYVASKDKFDEEAPEIAELGFDPYTDAIAWQELGGMLMARKKKLKDLLTDQRFIAGLGAIYSDEVLWAAGLRYDRSTDSLSTQEVRRLHRALLETLHDAVKLRGSSLADQQYRDLYGAVGSYQNEHKVYAREGQPCQRCRGVITRHKWSGRSTFLCESCQV
jgi:formamidopyrimidine-DNA glycosylase